MLAPELLVTSEKAKPVPLPPLAPKSTLPRGATDALVGLRATPAPTVTLANLMFPRLSVTFTTSVTLGVAPAV